MVQLLKFFFWLGKLVSKLVPFKIVELGKRCIDHIISGWIVRDFKSCGKDLRVSGPIVLLGAKHMTIGHNFNCFSNLRLEAFDKHNDNTYHPKLVIGNDVSINYDCHIGCVNEIIIGNGVLIASKVFITDHFHGDTTAASLSLPPSKRKVFSKGSVVIGNNVWIGEGVAIMPNVKLGDNCIVGANSVVTKSFPRNSVIGGIPARLIKTII